MSAGDLAVARVALGVITMGLIWCRTWANQGTNLGHSRHLPKGHRFHIVVHDGDRCWKKMHWLRPHTQGTDTRGKLE